MNQTAKRINPETDNGLGDRRTYLGGSDAAVILGLSTFKSAYALACEKKGLIEPSNEPTERMRAGTCMEKGIDEWCRREYGWSLQEGPEGGKSHPEYSFIIGHVDRLRTENGRPTHVVEFKNIDGMFKDDWEEGIPVHYQVQLYVYMAIYDLPGILVACFGGNQFEEFTLERDPITENNIIISMVKFWENLQNESWMPSIDGSESSSKALKARFPRHTENFLEFAGAEAQEVLNAARDYKKASAEETAAKARKDAIGNRFKNIIGEAAGILLPDGSKITWNKTKDKQEIDVEALGKNHPTLLQEYAVVRQGHRRIDVRLKKEVAA